MHEGIVSASPCAQKHSAAVMQASAAQSGATETVAQKSQHARCCSVTVVPAAAETDPALGDDLMLSARIEQAGKPLSAVFCWLT